MIIEVSNDELDSRLDKFLKRKLKVFTQSFIEKSLRKGNIKVNCKKVKSNIKLNVKDKIFIADKIFLESKTHSNDENLLNEDHVKASLKFLNKIKIFENNDFIVFNKPSGLAVQGGSNVSKNLDHLIKSAFFKKNNVPRLVHRIDKDTSGIILLAKNLISTKSVSTDFKNHNISKSYLAIVHGNPGKFGIFNKNIKKTNNNFLSKNKLVYSKTLFINLFNNNNFSFLALQPITGRKHQIRLHLLNSNTPILGDKKYYVSNFARNKNMHLHAQFLKLSNGLLFEAKLPDYFIKTLDDIGGTNFIPKTMPIFKSKRGKIE